VSNLAQAAPSFLEMGVFQAAGVQQGMAPSDAPTAWCLPAFVGRFGEVSGGLDGASLTLVFRLVLEAQRQNEPVAWIIGFTGSFFPPDVAETGIDLSVLAVVRAGRALSAVRAADHLLRSGAFGLIVLDLGLNASLPINAQTRLVGLAKKHDTALLCITDKEDHLPSLGSLVSLRVQTARTERTGDRYRCKAQAVKDKRRGPGWSYEEVYRGPDGLR
jgi:recombination protein RecA